MEQIYVLPWGWRQYVPLKHGYTCSRPHGVTAWKTIHTDRWERKCEWVSAWCRGYSMPCSLVDSYQYKQQWLSSLLLVLAVLRHVTDITKQHFSVISEVLPKLPFLFEGQAALPVTYPARLRTSPSCDIHPSHWRGSDTQVRASQSALKEMLRFYYRPACLLFSSKLQGLAGTWLPRYFIDM
jgi:hypothetical protein